MEDKIWKTALYIRLSVEDGDEKLESNSVTNQKEMLRDYISNHPDLTIYDYYVDDGYSGTTFNRPAFQKMLGDMFEKKFNAIVVKDLSRLGRNYLQAGNYIEQVFPVANVRFIAINDDIDSYLKPESITNIIVPFKNLMNDQYSHDISNKIKSVLNMKKKRGEYVGSNVPFGYMRDPNNKNHLIIEQKEAEVVRLIFELTNKGYGQLDIAKKLDDMGILTPNAYRKKKKGIVETKKLNWSTRTIHDILRNQMYCGDTVQNKGYLLNYKIHKRMRREKENWEIVKDTHEPIIPRDVFERMQKTMTSRDRRQTKSGEMVFFSGKLKCYACGRTMMFHQSTRTVKKKKYINNYYKCGTYAKSGKKYCESHLIKETKLKELIFKAIKTEIKKIIDVDKVLNQIKNSGVQIAREIRKKSAKDNYDKIDTEIKQIKAFKSALFEDFKLNILTEEEYREYLTQYDYQIMQLTKRKNFYNDEIIELNHTNIDNIEWIETFKKYKNVNNLTREMINELINYIYIVDKDKIVVEFYFENEYEIIIDYLENDTKLKKKYAKEIGKFKYEEKIA